MPVDAPPKRGPKEVVAAFREAFAGEPLIVVSNREPYEHRWGEDVGEIRVKRPAGGLTSALDPLLQAVGGVWIAWGSGDADAAVVDGDDRVRVPPEEPKYTLRRLWLDQHDVNRYYLGFANQFLWPLCHFRPALTRVRARYWERYRRVNRRFAEAVLDEARNGGAAVWFQDYHLALAPAYVRARRPDLALAHFWHIPWPPLEIFDVTPQGRDLIGGLLANDLLGFQLESHSAQFLRCAQELLSAEIDWEKKTARIEGHTCHVRSFPISIDVDAFTQTAEAAEDGVIRLRERYCPPNGQLGIGVDRMDYSKGLPEKLKALDLLWERYPEYRGRFTFVQVGVPSRTDIEAYDELTQKVERLVWEINDRYGTAEWQPVHLIKQSLPTDRLTALYRAADVCVVASLRDGMNLVSKEFVASQVDRRGVLLLSKFAGAYEELEDALEINPYDPEDFARILRDALAMPPEERAERIERMQDSLRTIYDWMADIFNDWGGIRGGARLPGELAPPPERRAARDD
ncbi:MAG TPA: trehalose-6-phosphate synthase [Longimicrobiales bacterium]|nr:trehalose-6-phosphate synthase [Longimicrobiales bacterium]